MPRFPADHLYEVNLERDICGKYQIVDHERVLFQHVEDLPLESCRGVFGFTAKDIAPVMDWTRDRIKDGKQCQASMSH